MSAEFYCALLVGVALGLFAALLVLIINRPRHNLELGAAAPEPWRARESIAESYDRKKLEVDLQYAEKECRRMKHQAEVIEVLRKDWPIGRPVYLVSNQHGPCMTVVGHAADMTYVAATISNLPAVGVAWISEGKPQNAWYPVDALVRAPREDGRPK